MSTWHKVAAPINVTAAWFTTIAVHEYGHVVSLDALGARDVTAHLTPTRDSDGRFQFGLTSYRRTEALSTSRESFSAFAGAGANFLQSVTFRGALRAGIVPKWLQPTFAWMDMGGRAMSYYHSVVGLARIKGTDLSKTELWVPATFLVSNIVYDVLTFYLSDDTLKRYFGVLIGEGYYPTR